MALGAEDPAEAEAEPPAPLVDSMVPMVGAGACIRESYDMPMLELCCADCASAIMDASSELMSCSPEPPPDPKVDPEVDEVVPASVERKVWEGEGDFLFTLSPSATLLLSLDIFRASPHTKKSTQTREHTNTHKNTGTHAPKKHNT